MEVEVGDFVLFVEGLFPISAVSFDLTILSLHHVIATRNQGDWILHSTANV